MRRSTIYKGMLSDWLSLDEQFDDDDYYQIGKKFYQENKETRDFEYYKVDLGSYQTIDYEELGRDIAESFVKE